MPDEVSKEIELEIAYVLFIDVVGYSKLLTSQQRRLLDLLNTIVRDAEHFRSAETKGRLITVPTGDGMALVFYNTPEAPVECALEISSAANEHPELKLRMGIHSGPVSGVVDVSGRANIAGAGINLAQRVMDCGDAGHVLLSKHIAEDLEQYGHWKRHLHELGECEVKHGQRISVVNLYTENLGNPEVPQKFRQARKRAAPVVREKTGRGSIVAVAIIAVAALVAGAVLFSKRHAATSEHANTATTAAPTTQLPSAPAIPEKSIAVLPFENLSDEKQNAYFTDGVQDEILTNLAKIADLKVISRTSVMQYKNAASRNLPEIAQTLKVAHVLEGSVQRAVNRVRVNAQLIDARTDAHLWAQTYDRDLADVFAIQSEIAKTIADQLQAKLSSTEQAVLEAKPTKDLVAYDAYLRAQEIERNTVTSIGVGGNEETKREIPLLEEAIRRDPAFVSALCALAHAHLYLYWQGADDPEAHLSAAKKALDAAARFQPDAGEVHFGRAELYYRGSRDYESALAELQLAAHGLPNDTRVGFFIGLIDRRQGKFEQAIRQFERVLASDPRNVAVISETAVTYGGLRRHSDAARVLDSALAWKPSDFGLRYLRADLEKNWKADLGLLEGLVVDEAAKTANASDLAEARFELAIRQRDYHTAEAILEERQVPELDNNGFFVPREWKQANIARGLGEGAKANAALLSARDRAAAAVRQRPGDGKALISLAGIDAALGRKEDALQEGKHAAELLPVTKDALNGAEIATRLTGIYAQVESLDRAFNELEKTSQLPFGVTYGSLKLDPLWDPLRGDPRFEQIVASLAPK